MYTKNYKNFLLLIILYNYKVNCSICDSECLCRINTKSEHDIGEYIDCSHRPSVLNSSDNLPNTVYSLDLSMNNITTIKPSNLYRSKSMVELYLNLNRITELNNVLELPELKLLDLSDNVLEFIHEDTFRGLRQLEYLNLANNKFTSFDVLTFHHLSNLNGIVLDYNNIGPSLREVNLFDRNGFGLTHKIKNISMRGISLNKVPDNFLADAYDLKKLVISDNNLTEVFEIPFTLEHLDLSDNPITIITMEDFAELPALKELKLNNLRIKEVPEYVFSPLHALVHLELERNRNLTEFSPLAFGREVVEDPDDFVLEILSVKGSRLTTIDEKLMEPFGQLIKLDLQGNPWTCDCHLSWVKKLKIEARDYGELRCASPRPYYNKKIFDLEEKYFVCAVQRHYIGITIAVVTTCVVLATIALWLFLFLPRYQSRCNFMQNLFSPLTEYAVLPLSVPSMDRFDTRN